MLVRDDQTLDAADEIRTPVFADLFRAAFMMLGLHALIPNEYTRYNLILIGPPKGDVVIGQQPEAA